jgi:uncharacterized protein YbaR (Trm112 family)
MFIDLVDVLRCPQQHQESILVASPDEMSGRYMLRGLLGCPVCRSEFPVRDGIAWFGGSATNVNQPGTVVSDFEALRCAALLDLHGNAGFAVLGGEWGLLAPALTDAVRVHLVLLNPPASVKARDGISILMSGDVPPLAAGRARGIAMDARLTGAIGIARLLELVSSGGRAVAPLDQPIPPNAHLLASDERHWVAEVSHPTLTAVQVRRDRPG